MSSASNNKRNAPESGVSVDNQPRLSGDDSEIGELEESEALVEHDGDDTKCRTGCIYLITNPINGKVYVGQTIDYKTRMRKHKCAAKNPKQYIAKAIKKYGWENFTKEILIDEVPEEDLDNLEINYIDIYNSFGPGGYNLTKGGGGLLSRCTGCIRERNGRFRCRSAGKDIGTFASEEEAKAAFIAHQQHGTPFKRKREIGTGSINERISKKGKRFRGRFKGKNTKTYDSRDLAQIALDTLISENFYKFR